MQFKVMVWCEVCGERAAEVKAKIESSILKVCSRCATLGNVIAKIPFQEDAQAKKVQLLEPTEITETIVEDYAKRIRTARESANLTQKEFALKLNVSLAVLKAAESGKRLDLQTAKKIEKVLGIKLVSS
jgi:uncharacterized protein (TIGR00270 family)